MRSIATLLLMTAIAAGLAGQERTSKAAGPQMSGLRTPLERDVSSETSRFGKPFQYNGNGHVYFATGVCQHAYPHIGVGGGGEAFVWRGLAIGAEAGYHQFVEDAGFGLASLDIGYHFTDRKRPKRFDPFVKVSPVGVAFSSGAVYAAGVGGGINYWFKEMIGLRTEIGVHPLGVGETLVMFRIGVNFR